MADNDMLLIAMAFLSAASVFIAWRISSERLYSMIVILLILVTSAGGKLVEFFGHTTNTGNIFYASVFLATYFLIERYGRREGIRSIWIGVAGVIFFSALIQTAIALTGEGSTAPLNDALVVVFSTSLRIAIASLAGYIVSQNVNVYLYVALKKHFNGSHLWLRANVSNAVAQMFDSAVFFTIAFMGVVAPANVWDIIFTGFLIKVAFMMAASPLLYLNKVEQEDGRGYSTVTLH